VSWQCIALEVTVKVFKRCCTFSAVEETDDDMLGKLGVSVRKVKSLTPKMETVTLIGKGR